MANISISSPLVALITVVAGALSSPISAQYWRAEGQPYGPSARRGHAMAYHASRQEIILRGGIDSSSSLLEDTFRLKDMEWNQLGGNTGPQDRQDLAMAYDVKRKCVVVFGGRLSGLGFAFDDTWEYDGAWHLRQQSSNPTGRYGHAMAYDPISERVVMFGGNVGSSQTWVWDGNQWLASFTPTYPAGRREHAMATDSLRERIVLTGGTDGTNVFSDTWEWDGTDWLEITTATLPPRSNHAMAFDVERQRMVVNGGVNGSALIGSTYEYDGVAWQDVSTPGEQGRRDHTMAYDESLGRVVRFGGYRQSNIAELHVNRPSGVAASTITYGAGCGQPALEIAPDPTARPVAGHQARVEVQAAPSAVGGVMIGWSNQMFAQYPLPVTLGILGTNSGCELWQSADVVGIATQSIGPTTLRASVNVPNSTTLVGSHAYLQAYCFAPGANSLQVIVSNALDWRIGAL